MATLAEIKAAVPAFFTQFGEDAEISDHKNHVIVKQGKSVRVYRYVPHNTRPEVNFVKDAKSVSEAKDLIKEWGVS